MPATVAIIDAPATRLDDFRAVFVALRGYIDLSDGHAVVLR
jgi:hypothetical protein